MEYFSYMILAPRTLLLVAIKALPLAFFMVYLYWFISSKLFKLCQMHNNIRNYRQGNRLSLSAPAHCNCPCTAGREVKSCRKEKEIFLELPALSGHSKAGNQGKNQMRFEFQTKVCLAKVYRKGQLRRHALDALHMGFLLGGQGGILVPGFLVVALCSKCPHLWLGFTQTVWNRLVQWSMWGF